MRIIADKPIYRLLRTKYDETTSLFVPTSRATIAVDIRISIKRQMIMNNILHIINIQSACSKISTHQHVRTTTLESKQRPLTIFLLHRTMKRRCHKTLPPQEVIHPVYRLPIVEKHYATLLATLTQDMSESIQLVFLWRTHHILTDTPDIVIVHTIEIVETHHISTNTHKPGNKLTIRSRQQNTTFHIRQQSHNITHLLLKTQLKRLVKLINDKRTHPLCRKVSLLQMVKHTPRRTDDDARHHLSQAAMFLHSRTPPIHSNRTRITAKPLSHPHSLNGKFTTRYQHKYLRRRGPIHITHLLNDREQISKSFAAARRRKQHDIVTPAHDLQHILLHSIEVADTKTINIVNHHNQ